MPPKNGTRANDAPDPLDLGDLTPAMTVVTIVRDGLKVELEAYYYDTCPVSIDAEIGRAHDDLMAVFGDDAAKTRHRSAALGDYYRAAAKALIPGLSYAEADNLAGRFPLIEPLLRRLRFLQDEAAGQGEATGEAAGPTTATSSPDSPSPTPITATATG